MVWANRAKRLAQRLLHPARTEQELDEEVRTYFDILTDRAVARGMPPQEAARCVRGRFESEQVKELVREERVGAAIDITVRDLRHAWRGLAKNLGFTIFAVLTIALGLGANAAMFSVLDGVLLKSSGYPEAERIVQLWEKPPGGTRNTVSAADFRDWSQQSNLFQSIAARSNSTMSYTGGSVPRSLEAAMVSPGYFDVFGAIAHPGRTFAANEDEPGKQHVVVISHRLWVNVFAGDPALIGKTIRLNDTPYTLIGVLPENSPFDRQRVDVWIPLVLSATGPRNYNYLTVVAKLRPGIRLEQAQAEMDALAARIAELYPAERKNWGVFVDSYVAHLVGPSMRQSLTLLMLAVIAVLMIACANLSNLLMTRGTTRSREIALRLALGAGRTRIVRMLLTEALIISAGGAIVAIVLGHLLLAAIQRLLPPHYFPAEVSIAMDGRVLLYLAAATLLMTVAVGILPAMQASRRNPAETLKEGGRSSSAEKRSTAFQNTFIAGQVAAALVLLVGAGLLIRSFRAVLDVDLGFNAERVVAVGIPLPTSAANTGVNRIVHYVTQLVEEVRSDPAIANAAITTVYPLRGWDIGMRFRLDADKDEVRSTGVKMVTPGYFQTIGLKLLAGRLLDEHDSSGAPPVLVVNDSFAKRFFSGSNAIGRRVLMKHLLPAADGFGPEVAWEIVGIVADEKVNGPELPTSAGVYASFVQNPILSNLALVAKGKAGSGALMGSIRRAVNTLNKNQVLDRPMTVDQIKADWMTSRSLSATLLGGFSIMAMLLAATGIYGVVSFATARRTKEFGIRMALGADRMELISLVIRRGSRPILAGIILGLIGALALGRAMRSMLFGIGATDLPTLAVVSGVLIAVALTACLVPAWRATRVEPISALRLE